MIDESVRLPRRRRASASCTTPSTSSTPGATTASTRCAARPRPPRRAPRSSASATPTGRRCRRSSRTSSARSRRRSPARSSASTRTTTATARSPAASWPSRPAPRQVQGTDQRLRRALRQRQPRQHHPGAQAQDGLPVVSDEQLERLTETSHFVADVVNAAIWAHAPYVGRSAFAHKGGMHVAAVEKAPQTFEHVDPEKVGNEQRIVVSELSGKGAVVRKAQELGPPARGRRRARRHRAAGGSRRASTRATTTRPPTPRSTCCCARSSRRTSRCSASRASA